LRNIGRLQGFETEELDNREKKQVQQFLRTVFEDVIAPLFDPKLSDASVKSISKVLNHHFASSFV
jgi:hypothetical protein